MKVYGTIIVDKVKYNVEAISTRQISKYGINGGKVTTLIVWKPKADVFFDEVYTARPVICYKHGVWQTEEPKPGTPEDDILQTALACVEIEVRR